MPKPRLASRESGHWQSTRPVPLSSLPIRSQDLPPLTEVLYGLDSRELDGNSMFDPVFGEPLSA